MHPRMSNRGGARVVKWLVVGALASLVGCGTLPSGPRSSSTPYKGDATWNIASPLTPGPVAHG